jgi:CHAD domain-containing protein
MPIAGRTEIEAKYVVPDGSIFERLLAIESLGEYRLVARGEQRVTDRYFDTQHRDLFHGGYACRRRVGDAGGPEVVAVKGLGGARGAVHRRSEHEVKVPPGTPVERWPAGPGRDIVLQLTRERPLVELFTVSQHRTVRDVKRRGRRVAVLSLDRVEFGAGATPAAYELEIELTPFGDAADLRALGKLLHPFSLQAQPLSKFERALALMDTGVVAAPRRGDGRGRRQPEAPATSARSGSQAASAGSARPAPSSEPGPPGAPAARALRKGKRPGVLPGDPMAEAGRKILRFHFEKMLAHEAGTIAGDDPEELHDMRVATRRQRAALRIVEPHFRRKAIRPVRDGLRTLGGCLGAVRDLDVLLAAARAHQSNLGATDARDFQHLVDAWTRGRDAARVQMLAHLSGQSYADFKDSYTSFLDTPGAGARAPAADVVPRPTLVSHVLRPELWAHYGAVCAFETVLPWASVETLHALRIEGKRLRYLLEFFREVLDRCVEEAIESVVALQDQLGELQDAVVTIGLVRDFLAGPEAAANPGAAASAGRYLESRQARIGELRRSIDRPWNGVSGSAFKSCLSRAVAAL